MMMKSLMMMMMMIVDLEIEGGKIKERILI